jgi:hypothetical protein
LIAKSDPAKTQLETIAAEVRQEVQKLNVSVRTALAHAVRVGQLLLQAKREFQRGSWERWVRKECEVGPRQAQKFMQLARHHDKLNEEDVGWMNKLTINEALARLRKILGAEDKKERGRDAHPKLEESVELHTRRCERFERFQANRDLRKGEQKVVDLVEAEAGAFANDVIKLARRHGRQLARTDGLNATDADPVLLGMLLCARLKLDPTSDFAPNEGEEADEAPAAVTA